MEWMDETKLKVGMIVRLSNRYHELYEVVSILGNNIDLNKLRPGPSKIFSTNSRGLYPFNKGFYCEIETQIKPIKNIDKHLFV